MVMPLSWNSAPRAGTRRELPCKTMESLERSPGTRNVSCQLSSAANATVGLDPTGERLHVPTICSWALRSTRKRFLYHRVAWVVTVPLSQIVPHGRSKSVLAWFVKLVVGVLVSHFTHGPS